MINPDKMYEPKDNKDKLNQIGSLMREIKNEDCAYEDEIIFNLIYEMLEFSSKAKKDEKRIRELESEMKGYSLSAEERRKRQKARENILITLFKKQGFSLDDALGFWKDKVRKLIKE